MQKLQKYESKSKMIKSGDDRGLGLGFGLGSFLSYDVSLDHRPGYSHGDSRMPKKATAKKFQKQNNLAAVFCNRLK